VANALDDCVSAEIHLHPVRAAIALNLSVRQQLSFQGVGWRGSPLDFLISLVPFKPGVDYCSLHVVRDERSPRLKTGAVLGRIALYEDQGQKVMIGLFEYSST
jgi:hypothetical protein